MVIDAGFNPRKLMVNTPLSNVYRMKRLLYIVKLYIALL